MATNALTTGAPTRATASPAINPTRRALLGSALLAPIAASAAVMPAASTSVDRSAWDRTMSEWLRADAASKAASATIDRAAERYQATKPAEPAITWADFPAAHPSHVLHALDLDAYQARVLGFETIADEDRERRLAEIARLRSYRAGLDEADRRSGWTEAAELDEVSGAHLVEVAWRLILLPAPDLAAALWKLDWLFGDDVADGSGANSSYSIEALAAIMADVRRFAGEAA